MSGAVRPGERDSPAREEEAAGAFAATPGVAAAEAQPRDLEAGRRRARDLGWTLFGKLAMTGANSLLVVSLAWFGLLDNKTYGLFTAVVAAQLLLSRLVLLGVDQGAIRLYTLEDLRANPALVLAGGLVQTLLLAAPVLALGVLAAALGLGPWPPLVVLSVVCGAAGIALFDYGVASRLARLRYRRAGLAQAAMPVARMAATLLAVRLFPQRPTVAFLAYAFAAVVFGYVLTHRTLRSTDTWPPFSLVRRLFAYSKWPGAADVLMILCVNEGIFLLGALGQEDERGLFGFGVQLSLGFFAVFLAFYQTLLPRASRLGGVREVPAFLKRWLWVGVLLAAACLALAPVIAAVLYSTMPNDGLRPFPPVFFLLTGFVAVLLVEAPLTVVCHYLLLPQLPVANLALRALVVGLLGLRLAPRFGAVGAGIAQVAGSAFSTAALAVALYFVVRRRLRED